MNIPNILTAIRLLLIPVFGYYLYYEQYVIAVTLFILGGITDVLDGYIARKYNMITSFGKVADPIADKLMQVTALVLLTIQNVIPIVILIIVVAKEAFMIVGGILLYKKDNFVVSANWYGKLATVVFYLAIVLSIFKVPYSIVFVYFAVLVTLFAFFMYSISYRKIRNEKKHNN